MLRALAAALLALLSACSASVAPTLQPDPLPSWSEGSTRDAIINFIGRVTDEQDVSFVPPDARIAAFDHDGTLIVEKPTLAQFAFVYERIRQLAPENPEWSATQPWRAVLEGDQAALDAMGFRERAPLLSSAQSGISQDEFAAAVDGFLRNSMHPRFGLRWEQAVYAPMLELINYLYAHDFRIFIVSGGGDEFIRRLSEPVYRIPKERVIGSRFKTELSERDGRWVIMRRDGFASLNVGRFKPLNLRAVAGGRPILAVGNSDGDIQLLQYAAGSRDSLVLLVDHDDGVREYAYRDESAAVLETAAAQGWIVVSMARDFNSVFSGERQ